MLNVCQLENSANLSESFMATLHLFGGEKGGVGKSFVARTALQYHLDRQNPCIAFDADYSNPDLKRCYSHITPVQLAFFSERGRLENMANTLIKAALKQDTLVNMPTQSFIPLTQWIAKHETLKLLRGSDLRFVQWFVSDCGYDSLKLFTRSVQHFEGMISHVLVRNLGMTDDWEPLETNEELQQLIQNYSIQMLSFPKFIGNKDRNHIDKRSLSFGEARSDFQFGVTSRQRIKSFLRRAYTSFDEAEVFDKESIVNKPEEQARQVDTATTLTF